MRGWESSIGVKERWAYNTSQLRMINFYNRLPGTDTEAQIRSH
jgi:hypothetical protein